MVKKSENFKKYQKINFLTKKKNYKKNIPKEITSPPPPLLRSVKVPFDVVT